MAYRLFFLLAILLTSGLSMASDDWVRVSLNDHTSVEFPLVPEVLDGDDDVMLACRDSFGFFTAVVGSLPEAQSRDTGASGLITMYRGLADRKLDFDNGRLMKMQEFEHAGIPGLEFSYMVDEGDADILGKFVRFWFKDGSMYSLEVWFDAESASRIVPRKNRYFNSFTYAPKPTTEMDVISMIKDSFTALVIGVIGVLLMVLLIIRRRSRRKTRST